MTVLTMDRPTREPAGPPRGTAGLDALLASATSEVLVMRSSTSKGSGPIGAIRQVDFDNLARGVRYRVLLPDPARTAPQLAGKLATLALAGAITRTVPEVPADALVIDGKVAVLPVVGGADTIATFRLPSVLTMTIELFERVWAQGAPLSADALPDEPELTPRERQLLPLLFSGSTDEAAAARLGIAVRTVRRTVAVSMNRLGARSRFQLGAKAAQQGWLLDQAG